MKKLSTLLCMVACLFGCNGNQVSNENIGKHENQIVNGTSYSGHPAAVYVYLGGGSCTGTLISPTIVLTAKHCMEDVSTSSIEVMFGNDAYSSDGEWISAIHYENNPGGYSGGPGDLALITLASPGPVPPIPVNTIDASELIGIQIHIVGFGVTSEDGSDSGEKRHGWTSLLEVEPGLIYASVEPSSTCYGDSGGPNFIILDGKEYVLGATSFGTDSCGYGLDASARTDDSYEWIKNYILKHEKSVSVETCEKDGYCVAGCGAPDADCPCAADGYCTSACDDMKLDVDCVTPPGVDPVKPDDVEINDDDDVDEKLGSDGIKPVRTGSLLWVGCNVVNVNVVKHNGMISILLFGFLIILRRYMQTGIRT
jgi:V8-like Glu-specific endopeptidase